MAEQAPDRDAGAPALEIVHLRKTYGATVCGPRHLVLGGRGGDIRERAFQSATVTQPVLRHARPVVASGRRTSCGLLGGVGDFPEPLGLRILARSS